MIEKLKSLPALAVMAVGICVFAFVSLVFLAPESACGIVYNCEEAGGGESEETYGGQANEPRDIYGTKSGTSTSPTTNVGTIGPLDWPNSDFSDVALQPYPTTSKPIILDGQADISLFTFSAITNSTTGYFSYDIFGSNDSHCTTTASSTTDDNYNPAIPIKSEITWYDIGSSGGRVSGSVDLSTPTNPDFATGTSRLLTDNNWKCYRVDLRGASTTVGVQLIEKIK